jgi:hypothetical protein
MNITQVAQPGNPWILSPRTLTGAGSSINTGLGSGTLTLANGTTASFGPPAGEMRIITLACAGLANVTWNAGLGTGGSFIIGLAGASGAPLMITTTTTNGSPFTLQNAGSVSGTYRFTGCGWIA